MKRILFILIASMVSLSLASCGGKMPKQSGMITDEDSVAAADTTDSVATDTTSSATETSTDDQSGGWFYDKNVDDLTGNVTAVNGYLVSKNSVEYDSGKTTKLMIALKYGKLSASVQNAVLISFVDDDYKSCRFADFQGKGLLAVFDDGEVDDSWRNLSLGSSSDGLMIYWENEANAFINKLKRSKTCKIQVTIEGAGKKTFEFNCQGLQWDFK